jgi:DNA-binding response OmpR family regulator
MPDPIDLGNISIDRDRFEVWVAGQRLDLTRVEFDLLYQLARNAGKVMTRQRLLQSVWSERNPDGARKLTVHVSRLRKKLANSWPWRVETVTKRGYVLADARRRDVRPDTTTDDAAATLGRG